MLYRRIAILLCIGAIVYSFDACSNSVAADIDGVVSIELRLASPQFGSQTLTVDSTSIRYVKHVPNMPSFARDTLVQDSAFLVATLAQVNMGVILLQGDAIDPDVFARDEGYSIMTIIYWRKADLRESTKIIKYTDPPPSTLVVLDQAMVEKLIEIHDK